MVIKMDKNLDSLEELVVTMAEKVVRVHKKVLELLENYDTDLAIQVIKRDDFINKLEEEVNDEAITSLALLAPVASDLRRVIGAIKIAGELERIADYSKNISAILLKNKVNEDIKEYSKIMMKTFIEMLELSINAYRDKDLDLVFVVAEKDNEIDSLFKELETKLIGLDDINIIKEMFSLTGLLRAIERAGDHTVNICEQIVYVIKGHKYDFD